MLQGFFSPRSLPARVFRLIVGIIVLVELLVVLPEMGKVRQDWLAHRMEHAQLVVAFIRDGSKVTPQMCQTLLRISRAVGIKASGGGVDISLQPNLPSVDFGPDIDLDQESLAASTWRAGIAVLDLGPPYARLHAGFPSVPGEQIEIIVSQRIVAQRLRIFLARTAALGLALAIVTASLVFLALDRFLVRPMHIMTASIAGFRRNPGHAGLGGLKWLASRGDDEISRAARELVAMQDELSAALWRNARLAALGTAVAKISHDLRNILTSAMLVAERLHRHDDPAVRQAANTLIPVIERAVEMVSYTVAFAQDGMPALTLGPVELHPLVAEVADMLRATDSSVAIDNLLPVTLILPLDRNQIYRVLLNLLRNAMEAGASRITVQLAAAEDVAVLLIADNGPGLPASVIANLFRPFTGVGRSGGTGLGLAIARDLIRAHGGDLSLRRTGPEGAEFAISFATS